MTRLHLGCGGVYLVSGPGETGEWVNIDISGFLAKDRPDLVERNSTDLEHYYKQPGGFDSLPKANNTVVDCIGDFVFHGFSRVEEIVCIQALEHLSPIKVSEALDNWHSTLIPGGKVTLSVPDMDGTLKMLEGSETERAFAIRHLRGSLKNEYSVHKTWFTNSTLTELLHHAGFKNIELLPNMHSYPAICIRCVK